jgi:D-3-phosphoglycerate dehydrogenase
MNFFTLKYLHAQLQHSCFRRTGRAWPVDFAHLGEPGYPRKVRADELLKIIPDYDALIVRGQTRVTAAVIEAASKLKVIGRAGVGVDNIDLETAKKHKIAVVNTPTSTTVAVAELSLGLLLALAREIPRADATMKQGQWNKKEFEGVELQGKILGIIGYGRIGIEVGKRAAAFGMNVIVYDPNVSEDELSHSDAEPVSIQDLFAWSDFISLHLPLNVQTRDLMGPLAFSQMKDGVRIVCAARGGIIDESALVDALNSGKVARAALDVFEKEPPWLNGISVPSTCDRHSPYWCPDRGSTISGLGRCRQRSVICPTR